MRIGPQHDHLFFVVDGVDRKQKEHCEHEAIVKVSEVFVLRISVSLNAKTYHNDHGNGYVNSYQQCQRKD